MREHADHHDAELMLRLYEIRREEKLRLARDWFIREFQAESMDDFMKRFPPGSTENAYFRMVVSYWDMAASIVNQGLISEDLFFENNPELWTVWEKIRQTMPERRAAMKNPYVFHNLESVAGKYEKWVTKRAPEAPAAMRERMKAFGKKP